MKSSVYSTCMLCVVAVAISLCYTSCDRVEKAQRSEETTTSIVHQTENTEALLKKCLDQNNDDFCNRAIKINPKDAKAFDTLGIVQVMKGRNSEAIILFEKAIELDPQEVKYYYNIDSSAKTP
jgi:tetratricopeptide (TPR) repeat protein